MCLTHYIFIHMYIIMQLCVCVCVCVQYTDTLMWTCTLTGGITSYRQLCLAVCIRIHHSLISALLYKMIQLLQESLSIVSHKYTSLCSESVGM